jgi:uncharacterized protein with PQ loop repeat
MSFCYLVLCFLQCSCSFLLQLSLHNFLGSLWTRIVITTSKSLNKFINDFEFITLILKWAILFYKIKYVISTLNEKIDIDNLTYLWFLCI